jgi:hypothetical protein
MSSVIQCNLILHTANQHHGKFPKVAVSTIPSEIITREKTIISSPPARPIKNQSPRLIKNTRTGILSISPKLYRARKKKRRNRNKSENEKSPQSKQNREIYRPFKKAIPLRLPGSCLKSVCWYPSFALCIDSQCAHQPLPPFHVVVAYGAPLALLGVACSN